MSYEPEVREPEHSDQLNIELVVVCVDYSDFLAYTLPHNKVQFNRMVVVTTTKDKKTQRLCEHNYVRCVTTDAFYNNGAGFNKGAGINEGLRELHRDGWVVHMDADILLPPQFRSILNRIPLNEDCIYGLDRIMCPSFEAFQKFIREPEVQHQSNIFVIANAFPFGVRVARLDQDGWLPIGFFQMWSPKGSGVYIYSDDHSDAGRTDMLHALRWPRNRRVLLPEFVAVHLESEVVNMGANWNGRKTKLFGI